MNTEDNDLPAFYKLATRYLVGEASSRERDRMVKMLQQPDRRQLFDAMRAEFEGNAPSGSDDFGLDEVSRKLAELTAGGRKIVRMPKRRLPSWKPWLLAACATLAVAVAIVGIQTGRNTNRQASEISWVTYATGPRERLYVSLHDGSKIVLNAGSTLSSPDSFDDHTRVVRLSGEAYFDVSRDESRPFVVETTTLRVTVLGTRFNVRAFNDGSQAQVALISGRVKVSGIGPSGELAPVEMTPGLQYSFTARTGEGKVEPVAAEASIQWTKTKEPRASAQAPLVFDQEPLASVASKLEQRFGVPLEISQPELGQKKVTGRFETEPLEEILKVLRMAGAFDYRLVRKGEQIERVILSAPSKPISSEK
ncbi:anti-FecI sigma factor FecR [Opitutaceae bacterium TAV5]|nr:anti-FecI sigma factor FecR [Opitutaceae bacterium TAV5]